MNKIPTIFYRGTNFRVVDKVREECAWVFAGEGTATEKLDGTNVRLTIRSGQCVRVEKRRNPTKEQKKQGITGGWYTDADCNAPEDRWIFEGVKNTVPTHWSDGEHHCEALGPKIQGNPLELDAHICVPFNLDIPTYDIQRSYKELHESLAELQSKYSPEHLAEGIVFHHPDGRRAKIKRKDFRIFG